MMQTVVQMSHQEHTCWSVGKCFAVESRWRALFWWLTTIFSQDRKLTFLYFVKCWKHRNIVLRLYSARATEIWQMQALRESLLRWKYLPEIVGRTLQELNSRDTTKACVAGLQRRCCVPSSWTNLPQWRGCCLSYYKLEMGWKGWSGYFTAVVCSRKPKVFWNFKDIKGLQNAVCLVQLLSEDGEHNEAGSIRDIARACCGAVLQHWA